MCLTQYLHLCVLCLIRGFLKQRLLFEICAYFGLFYSHSFKTTSPFASSDVQLGSAVGRSLTSTRTVTDNTGVSDTEDEMASEPESPAAESDWELLSDRDPVREDELDPEHSEEANYRETMRGVCFHELAPDT